MRPPPGKSKYKEILHFCKFGKFPFIVVRQIFVLIYPLDAKFTDSFHNTAKNLTKAYFLSEKTSTPTSFKLGDSITEATVIYK